MNRKIKKFYNMSAIYNEDNNMCSCESVLSDEGSFRPSYADGYPFGEIILVESFWRDFFRKKAPYFRDFDLQIDCSNFFPTWNLDE